MGKPSQTTREISGLEGNYWISSFFGGGGGGGRKYDLKSSKSFRNSVPKSICKFSIVSKCH